MSWLAAPAYFFLIIGVVAILIEVVLLQLTTFWLLFVGIGALLASLVVWIFPEMGWVGAMIVFAVGTAVITLLLMRPLKRWQHGPSPMHGNDAIGQKVTAIDEISAGEPGNVMWSGADWSAELQVGVDRVVAPGEQAEIVDMRGITLVIK